MRMRNKFPVWQVTLPVCTVLIALIGAFTTVYMINGRYLFSAEITPNGLKITTDVDKR